MAAGAPDRRLLLLALLAAAAGAPAAEDEGGAEYQVKAAFVCKFGNYVDWPPQALGAPGEAFRIGVLAGPAVPPGGAPVLFKSCGAALWDLAAARCAAASAPQPG